MEEGLLLAINGLRTPALDPMLAFLSRWGIYGFPLLMLFALRQPDRRAAAASIRDGWLTWFLSITVAETILKPILRRPRPTADEALREALNVLGSMPSARSLAFPSGTSTAAFAGAVWIGLRWGWRWGGAALALAGLVSFSRLYAGVHWPTDILGGAVLGAFCAWGLDRVSRRIER
ncbi:MAG: phosphatase PAP2 family protein [Sandaracinaceae bacterium]